MQHEEGAHCFLIAQTKKGIRFSSNPSNLVRLAGIEPTTPWFVAKYSIQLSYSREEKDYSRTKCKYEAFT